MLLKHEILKYICIYALGFCRNRLTNTEFPNTYMLCVKCWVVLDEDNHTYQLKYLRCQRHRMTNQECPNNALLCWMFGDCGPWTPTRHSNAVGFQDNRMQRTNRSPNHELRCVHVGICLEKGIRTSHRILFDFKDSGWQTKNSKTINWYVLCVDDLGKGNS